LAQIVQPTGASAIGVPGWPLLAFCTASIDRVRIVSIAKRSGEPSSCNDAPAVAVGAVWVSDME